MKNKDWLQLRRKKLFIEKMEKKEKLQQEDLVG
jgi:hypothetical protein